MTPTRCFSTVTDALLDDLVKRCVDFNDKLGSESVGYMHVYSQTVGGNGR